MNPAHIADSYHNTGTELLQPPAPFPGELWEAELVSSAPWFTIFAAVCWSHVSSHALQTKHDP